MKFLEGKTATEKKKIVAAGILGLIALVALWLAFGRSFFGGSTTASTKATPTPKPTASSSDKGDTAMPTLSQQEFTYQTTEVVYNGTGDAPEPGRNIFAFYEPPPPCTGDKCPPSPTPKPPEPKTPSPTPSPVFALSAVNPQTIYAGSKGFRLEAIGDRFTPDAQIYFNQQPMPTTYVNGQKLVTDIPANLIAQEGGRQIIVQSRDNKSYSDQQMINVQAPPKPTVQYIGMIGRKRYNNDTAYFVENDKSSPFGARLNDVVNSRFRLIAIAPNEVTFQDVDLGFKHRVTISKSAGGPAGVGPIKGMDPGGGINAAPFDPNGGIPVGDIPGIPNNIQRFNQGQAAPSLDSGAAKKPDPEKKDVDDDGDN